jgi:hypothetical protein
MTARYAKRIEARELKREIAKAAAEYYEDVQEQQFLNATRTPNASAPVTAGETVVVFESESGIMTDATVADIWDEKRRPLRKP